MTIYTSSKSAEKKDDSEVQPSPEVVTDCMLLLDNYKNEANLPKHHILVTSGNSESTVGVIRRRRFRAVHACVALISVPVIMCLLIGCIFLHKYFTSPKFEDSSSPREGIRFCGVVEDYHQSARVDPSMPKAGRFEQEFEVDEDYERIMVPSIGDTRRATILHDFNLNVTGIIDKDKRRCFVMPLNRTLVMPPHDFWDLLVKLKSGYFLLDAEVLRTNYRALTPPVEDLTIFGKYIREECRYFDTYVLAKEGEPVAMSKRSTCELAGDSYCLGDAGTEKMMCFRITGCM